MSIPYIMKYYSLTSGGTTAAYNSVDEWRKHVVGSGMGTTGWSLLVDAGSGEFVMKYRAMDNHFFIARQQTVDEIKKENSSADKH